ncbi:MAG TPA: cell division protein FtsZ, partial [Candidatus Polarisedimenticolia bacterium]|nr:cell division protein FtsZ [Candidatus Polarisedimenticolia bacterium]
DQVLDCGVRGVTDLMVKPGLINLDFADIRAVMTEMGKAMMGTGEAEGPNRAIGAAEAAISNPLLDDVSMKGARGVLINITGGLDMTLFEVDEAANRIRSEVDPEANIIFGSTFDQSLEGKVRISVVATGIEAVAGQMPRPVSLSLVSNGGSRQAMMSERGEPSLGSVHASAPAPAPSIRRDTVGATALAMPQPMAAQPAPISAPPIVAQAQPMAQAAPQYMTQPLAAQPAMQAPLMQPAEQRHYVAPPPVENVAIPAPAQAAPAPLVSTPVQPAAAQPRRAPNLFSRVTGNAATWAKQAVEPAVTPQMRASAPAKPAAPQPAPVLHVPAPQPAMSQPPVQQQAVHQPAPQPAVHQPVAQQPAVHQPAPQASPQPAPAVQPRLSGLDPKDRLSASRAEEDLLDIPAFLRRQAN